MNDLMLLAVCIAIAFSTHDLRVAIQEASENIVKALDRLGGKPNG